QLVLAVALYWPFFKVMERAELKLEAKKAAKKSIFSKEDEDTLAGLDLDF
ncbi:Putative permease IIC component ywbA, partial [Lacticaseibacillus paracasei subsp. paracasei CNCM I-2877]